MEAQAFRWIRRILSRLPHPRPARVQYSDRLIVLVYIWAVLHDRPVSWACQRCNWPRDCELPLPDESTLSRRIRTPSALQLIQRLHVTLCSLFQLTPLLKHMDSFPLPVGSYSHDRDARRGRAGHQLLAPPRRSEREVADPRRRRERNCPQRLRSLELLNGPLRHAGVPGGFGPQVHRQRIEMEQTLGRLRYLCLGGPPPWVRTPHRVAPWIAVKIILLNLDTATRRGEIKRLAA